MIFLLPLALIVAFVGYAPSKYGLRYNNHKYYILICGALIMALSALRTPYTGTTDNYFYTVRYTMLQSYKSFQVYYDQMLSDYDFMSSEAGYYYTMWLLGKVFPSGQTSIIVSSILITFATCFFIRRNSADVPLSLTIYICLGLFTFNMNAMRQAMAMSICLFAYEFAKERKLLPFILTVLLAMLYHKTAMCFFPVYFLPALKNDLGSWAFYIFGLILCLLFIDRIIVGYYEISGENYSKTAAADGGGLFVIMLYLGTFVLAIYKQDIIEQTKARTYLLATMTGFVAYIARFAGSHILERISYYYFYFPVLLIPAIFQELDEREHRFIKLFFLIGAVALFAYRIWKGGFNNFTLYFLE